jgi:hypothetical protein
MDYRTIKALLNWFVERVGDAVDNDRYQVLLVEFADLVTTEAGIKPIGSTADEIIDWLMSH